MGDLKRLSALVLASMPVMTPEEEAERNAQDARRAAEERRQRLESIGLPITAADENLLVSGKLRADVGRSLAAVQAWIADASAPPWIVLCGSVGRGKTLAAAWLLLEHGGRYAGARELERLRMAAFGDEAARFQELLSGRVLVIDDLGREDSPDRMTSALLDAVDARRRARMRTIAIANLTRKQLEQRYRDERLWSRLGERAVFVADAGPDLRAKGKP